MGMYASGPLKLATTTIPSHGYVLALLQWLKVYKFGEDELQRAPVVALSLLHWFSNLIQK